MNAQSRLLVISPHLDDAVLSCGLLLAANPEAVVCTVFTARPEKNQSTDWDRASGFADAFEAIEARKAEDVRALTLLGARAFHLPFCDAQYHSSPSHETLVAALGRALVEMKPATVVIPLGLFHSDHKLVANACLALMEEHSHRQHQPQRMSMYAYEDVPYRNMQGVVQTRLAELAGCGYEVCPADELMTASAAHDEQEQMKQQKKRAAIAAYESQLRAFGPDGLAGLVSPERYWRLQDKAADTNHV